MGGHKSVPPGSTTVGFTLEADGDGTPLSLRRRGLPDGEAAAMHEQGWRLFTARLALTAATSVPRRILDVSTAAAASVGTVANHVESRSSLQARWS
jgi:hypothetical protein